METPDWVSLGDEESLDRCISKLGLRPEETALDPLITHPLNYRPKRLW